MGLGERLNVGFDRRKFHIVLEFIILNVPGGTNSLVVNFKMV